VPSQLYRTRDGFIFIMCNKEKFWPVLCEAIGRPEWAEDPGYRRFADRLRNRDRLTRLLDEALGERTTAEWLTRFAGRVPAAPVNDVAAALDAPLVREEGRIWEVPHPARPDFRMLAAPFTCPGETLPRRAAPPLGHDTDAILAACGIAPERIRALRREGVV
jgi:crotonobetainyl-CoA:carnitine CoA-transferase CaiB-like acyl-CoA transferase